MVGLAPMPSMGGQFRLRDVRRISQIGKERGGTTEATQVLTAKRQMLLLMQKDTHIPLW
jgi:hypothetical protein